VTEVAATLRPPARVVAFHAYTDRAGGSCLTANIGLILASWGYRVLIRDLDFAAPSLYRYFSAFLPAVEGTVLASPVALACDFTDSRGTLDFQGPVADRATDPRLPVRRPDLTGSQYDFVLLGTPAGAESPLLTSELADVVVLGYSLDAPSMDLAAQGARKIRGGSRGADIELLPVPMRVDARASGINAARRAQGRQRFSWLLDSSPGWDPARDKAEYWDAIQIPYEPDYASWEGLAYLDAPSEQRSRLVAAYERLAILLAPGTVRPGSAHATEQTRTRYQAARIAVRVVHAPQDRYWAEWLVSELEHLGLTAIRQRVDQPAASAAVDAAELIVVSGNLLAARPSTAYLTALAPSATDDYARQPPLGVSVDGTELPRQQLPVLGYLNLADASPDQAHERLASYYDVPKVGVSTDGRFHYPGAASKRVSSLPGRDRPCHGRDDDLDRIRDYFLSGSSPALLTLTGPPGIGKSRLALEYAHRFWASYDLVFCIQADSEEAVRTGLAELALFSPPEHPGGDAGLSKLSDLESPDSVKWLLIYDGVESAAVLAGLVPASGHGHVLLTARSPVLASGAEQHVSALTPSAASGMLTGLGIPDAEATEIAEILQGVPLAISLAAGWIGGVQDQLLGGGIAAATVIGNAAREVGQRLADATDDSAAPGNDPVQLMVALLTELLGRPSTDYGAAALLLLRTCAFLAPAGISRRLLRSPEMLRQLREVDSRLSDPIVLQNVLRTTAQYGFTLQTGMPTDSLRIHQRVLELLRSGLAPAERTTRAAAVTRMLAASAPVAADNDVIGNSPVYAELLQHVEPSGAARGLDDEVRRWLVSQVRYLWEQQTMSTWRMARALGGKLARSWAANSPAGDNDPLLLQLKTQLANVHRLLGEFEVARGMDRDVLDRQRDLLGLRHLLTLMTARSYAADLRLAGDFEAALLEDQSTWQAHRQTLGDDHLMTIISSSNLAISELLYGELEQARRRLRDELPRTQRIAAERPAQEPILLARIGFLERQLGDYEKSRDSLLQATTQFENLIGANKMSPGDRWILQAFASLAATERRLGRPDIEGTRRALKDYENAYGELYPDVLGLILSLAGDWYALGDAPAAVREAQRARAGCSAVFGPAHPFTRICEVNLSTYALATGEVDAAAQGSAAALESLTQSLIPGHPWLQAATVARANALVAAGRLEEAQALEEPVLSEYQARLGPHNRLTKLIEFNAANTLKLLNEPRRMPDAGAGLRERAAIELDIPPY
jgi:hypothetical protein